VLCYMGVLVPWGLDRLPACGIEQVFFGRQWIMKDEA
jgi:hypothetical protein